MNDAHDKEEIVNGFVKCRTKGGMIVDVFGIEAFYQDLKLMLSQFEITTYMLERLWSLRWLKLTTTLRM